MSSIKKNFVYNVAYQVLTILIPIVTMPYLSRVLGTKGIGVYSYTYSIAECFGLFTLLGLANYGNRTIARNRVKGGNVSKVFFEVYAFQLIMGVVVVAVYLVYVLQSYSENRSVQLIWTLFLISVMLDINWFFFGLEKFKLTITRNMIVKLVTFIAIFLFVREENGVVAYCFVLAVGALVTQVVLWPFLLREVTWVCPTLWGIARHIKPNFVLFIPVVAVSIYKQVDVVILGSISGYDDVGLYENAYKVIVMPFAVISALGTVMLPRVTNLLAKGEVEKNNQYLTDSFWSTAIFASIIMFGIASISFELAPVYFGEAFSYCSILILIMIFDVPFRTWGNVIRTQYLMPLGRDREFVISVVAGAAVNLVINLMLIPFIGCLGAAIAMLLTQITVCLLQVWAVRSELPLKRYLLIGLPFYAMGAVMFVCVRIVSLFVAVDAVGLMIEVSMGAVAFGTCFVLYIAFSKDERVDRFLGKHLKRLKLKR